MITRSIKSSVCFNFCNISVVLVTGGIQGTNGFLSSVELLYSDGTKLCSLPDLPGIAAEHSQTGLLLCGGNGRIVNGKSCFTFYGGHWKKTHTIGNPWFGNRNGRMQHTAWSSPRGVLLLGGTGSRTTTSLLNNKGGFKRSFILKNKRV